MQVTLRVGFVGLGAMGLGMARNLRKQNLLSAVWNRHPAKAQSLAQETGCTAVAKAAELAPLSDVIVMCVSADADVLEVVEALAPVLRPGTIVIDCSTVSADTARSAAHKLRECSVQFLDAPVSGGTEGARDATLAIMVGGDAAAMEKARPVLRAMGPNIFHVGPAGAGNTVKAINNMMACVNSAAMMEGYILGVKAGLDPMTIYEVVKASSGGSKAIERIPRALIPRDFEPGFKVTLMNKDLETFHTIAKELHVPVTFSNLAQHYQQAALAAGLGEQDTSVVFTIIERLAGMKAPK